MQSPRARSKWILASLILLISMHVAQAWIGTHRVNETSTDGVTVQGDPITVTWSIVPDGTFIFTGSSGTFYSDFIFQMDEEFSVPQADRTSADLTQRSWFASLEESFEFFTLKTGITYIYLHENDDVTDPDTGTPMEPHALGILGKRGDARIGGSNTTGYAALSFGGPGNDSDLHGNMTFRTSRSWNASSLNGICSHENMHGVGFHHSLVSGGATLANYSLNGPQFDDLLGLHYKYGDIYEKAGGNDSVANATDLGVISSGDTVGVGLDISESDTYSGVSKTQIDFVSIDSNTDTDVFKFNLAQSQNVILKVSPRGPDYLWDVDSRGRYSISSKIHSDLSFRVLDASGSELYNVDSAAIGLDESIQPLLSSGDYYVEVSGLSSLGFGFNEIPTQFYALEVIDLTPTAEELGLVVAQNSSVNITLSGSASGSLSYTVASVPVNGTLTGTAPDLIYTPNLGYAGTDVFTYYVSDGAANSGIANVSINVIAPGLLAHWTLNETSGTDVADSSGNGFDAGEASGTWTSGYEGGAFEFDAGSDSVTLPASPFSLLDQEVTVAMWVYGDTTQPRSDTIFRAINSTGDRILNIHLPWSNSIVYWDAGGDADGFDRISKTANDTDFMGQWNHWIFTKNASAGTMKIYLNGVLWHSGTGETKSLSGITEAKLGHDFSGSSYDGIVDELRLYNIELTLNEVSELYSAYEPYLGWTNGYSSLTDQLFESDPDSDGIANGLEYVLASDPTQPGASPLPQVETVGGNLVISFNQLESSVTDTSQVLQYSTTLQPGSWTDLNITAPSATEVSIGNAVNGIRPITVTIGANLITGDRFFCRLKVSLIE